jgi:predicted nucleotide-binding protein
MEFMAASVPHYSDVSMPSSGQPPSCFIGSSTEGLPYAAVLGELLRRHDIGCEQWDLSTFALGRTTMENLELALARNSFAALIATGDDKTTSRGRAKLSPRDNVIFEFGLFAGRLGRNRTFLLVPEDVDSLKLPTDLLGVTVATFTTRRTKSARIRGMAKSAMAIADAVRREGPLAAPSDPALANELLMSVSRQLRGLRTAARVSLRKRERDAWVMAVLAAVLEPFLARSDDAYSEWLRPNRSRDTLEVVGATNLDADHSHHEWKRGEGLVGKVWETGMPKAVDRLRTDPWFKPRPSCQNETYLCVPIGPPGGPEGVLAVGSDQGFRVQAGDVGLLHAYGELLALAMPASTTG